MNHSPASSVRSAFSLIEVVIVTVILGILAATAIPAFSTMIEVDEKLVTDEVEAQLTFTRDRAVAEGRPYGLQVAFHESRFAPVLIAAAGELPSAARTPDGRVDTGRSVVEIAPGVRLASVQYSDGSSGSGIIWFGVDGAPQVRHSNGTFQSVATSETIITFTSGDTLRVVPRTGVITR